MFWFYCENHYGKHETIGEKIRLDQIYIGSDVKQLHVLYPIERCYKYVILIVLFTIARVLTLLYN